MQKKLIALAVAGLVAAPAMAQSNVTIYGVADAYFGFGSEPGFSVGTGANEKIVNYDLDGNG
ncbi:porin, partial [Herbidospora sp. RD11066]